MSAESRMELSRRNNDAAARAHTPLRHVQGKTLNLGPVPFKYLQEDFGAAVLPIKPLSDKQCRLRYVALVQAASVTDVKVDEVAADHGHDFGPLAGEFACLSDLAEMPISGVQVCRSDHYAAVRMTVPPRLCERETLNLGPVPYKYFDELSAARLPAPRPLSDQQRGACYSAPFDISTVLHNEIDGIFTKISHEDDPPLRFHRNSRWPVRFRADRCGMSVEALHNSCDAVNHPPHFNSHPSGVECITVTALGVPRGKVFGPYQDAGRTRFHFASGVLPGRALRDPVLQSFKLFAAFGGSDVSCLFSVVHCFLRDAALHLSRSIHHDEEIGGRIKIVTIGVKEGEGHWTSLH